VEWLHQQYALTALETVLLVVTSFAAGVFRGYTGFGSALAIAPVLALAVGPRAAIPAILLVMMISSVQLLPGALRDVNWPVVSFLSIGGAIGIPIGALLLIWVDQELVRRSISGIVIFFAILLMTGWRYRGKIRPLMSALTGGLGGFISGIAASGGPAVIIFLLAGTDSATRNRAAIILYFTFTQVVGLLVYWFGSLITIKTLWISLPMLPPLILGTWIGEKMFGNTSDALYRKVALSFLLVIGLSTFIA